MAGLTSAEAMQCALQADWAEAATAALKAQAMGGMLQRSGTAHASTMETQMEAISTMLGVSGMDTSGYPFASMDTSSLPALQQIALQAPDGATLHLSQIQQTLSAMMNHQQSAA